MHDPETTRHELPPVEEKRGSAIWFIGILLAIGGLIFLCVKYEGNPQDEQDYLQAANDVFTAMNGSSREINDCSRLLMNVWEHAIREVKDPQTDPYVCPKGKFIWFNDALKKLYEDPTFLNKLEVINEHQQEIRRLRKQLQTPPRSQQEANNLLLKMMDTYIEISMLLLGPQGSYDDVSKKLNDMMAQYREFGMELQACDGKGYQIHDIIGKR